MIVNTSLVVYCVILVITIAITLLLTTKKTMYFHNLRGFHEWSSSSSSTSKNKVLNDNDNNNYIVYFFDTNFNNKQECLKNIPMEEMYSVYETTMAGPNTATNNNNNTHGGKISYLLNKNNSMNNMFQVPINTYDQFGQGYVSDLDQALHFAIVHFRKQQQHFKNTNKKKPIILMSLSQVDAEKETQQEQGIMSTLLPSLFESVINRAILFNFFVVLAAGNANSGNICHSLKRVQAINNNNNNNNKLLIVGAIEEKNSQADQSGGGKRAAYSNYGECVNIFAKGKETFPAICKDWKTIKGTSVSAALVASHFVSSRSNSFEEYLNTKTVPFSYCTNNNNNNQCYTSKQIIV